MSIKIDTIALRSKAELLKLEKERIDNVLEQFKGGALKIDTYWSGDTGDMVKERLTKYSNKFDYISNRLEGYILFLEKTAQDYEDEDIMIGKKLDSNGEISAIASN